MDPKHIDQCAGKTCSAYFPCNKWMIREPKKRKCNICRYPNLWTNEYCLACANEIPGLISPHLKTVVK